MLERMQTVNIKWHDPQIELPPYRFGLAFLAILERRIGDDVSRHAVLVSFEPGRQTSEDEMPSIAYFETAYPNECQFRYPLFVHFVEHPEVMPNYTQLIAWAALEEIEEQIETSFESVQVNKMAGA